MSNARRSQASTFNLHPPVDAASILQVMMHVDIESMLKEYATSLFRCGEHSIHGLQHWCNVAESGALICKKCTDADALVVQYFAFLHDAWRLDDGADLEHGPRSADHLANLPANLANLTPSQRGKLDFAVRFHTDGLVSDDLTIGACWDADRLDLGRVGITPIARMMSTSTGKKIANAGSKYLYQNPE